MEGTQLNFRYSLNKLLFNHWEILDKKISKNIQELVKSSTDSEEFHFMILVIKRYIDDIFIIWPALLLCDVISTSVSNDTIT